MKVSLAAQVMGHTVAANLNALAERGKGHCTVCYELHYVINVVAKKNKEG
jgi:hypothetical protein